jgi:hypothetical protein
MNLAIDPIVAAGVLACTSVTDGVYVLFTAAVAAKNRTWAANWSGVWYLLAAFTVISYTQHAIYMLFAAAGSWLGAFISVSLLRRRSFLEVV